MQTKFYTGVGSRKTPESVLSLFTQWAKELNDLGYTLRSGGAAGADSAFEMGASDKRKEIYLPWRGFNGNTSVLFTVSDDAMAIARTLHPAWQSLSEGARKLMARNVYQVLGSDLKTPSEFLICYTPNGNEVGGTALAIRLARCNDIPIFNAGCYGSGKLMCGAFREFMTGVTT
jgi:hypothetical protein